ncbi:hypothetical protein [Zhihengliuella salsuginis]|uniref:Myo-inositol 2-dehydrogenase / D-chiro-inositol 1-dehydrogenase n=1 Tax=Zhihengliuella salsuginis TaxID=578222 RepID=A0ABQ3GIX6_9MICC|nr:hypothetical protein GCM10008096_14900 [Zhihengliuella salsuginis]
MTQKPVRFGLVGTGRIGRVHAASIAANPEAELAWVADPFVEGAHEDGRAALLLADAAQRSATEGVAVRLAPATVA